MICERKHSRSCMHLLSLSLSLMTFSPYFTEVKTPKSIFNQSSFFFFWNYYHWIQHGFKVKKPRVNHYNSNEGVFNFGPNVNWDHNKLSKAQKMMVHTDPSLPVTLKDSWPEDKAYTQTRVCWYDVLKECCYQR